MQNTFRHIIITSILLFTSVLLRNGVPHSQFTVC